MKNVFLQSTSFILDFCKIKGATFVGQVIFSISKLRFTFSLSIEPVSARSKTTVSARSVSIAEDRVRALEAEKDHLATLTQQLENEVHSYREVISTYQSGGNFLEQIGY